MKVLIQLLILNNGELEEGRKAWVGKDEKNRLIIENIYTTKDTAIDIGSTDLEKLKQAEKVNSLRILEVLTK